MQPIPEPERHAMLALAREAVSHAVTHRSLIESIPQHGIFLELRGIFVTLHVSGKLRGCIGVIEAEEPLGLAITKCAFSAALEDPRFSSLQPDELPHLEIELSLLSAISPLAPEEIRIGRHGLLIVQGKRRGLLLPQVAAEHSLDHEQFLAETCWKAGLPREAWRDPQTAIYGFSCEIIRDNESTERARG